MRKNYAAEIGYTMTDADGRVVLQSAATVEGRGRAATQRDAEAYAAQLVGKAPAGHGVSIDYIETYKPRAEPRRHIAPDGDSAALVESVTLHRGAFECARTLRELRALIIRDDYAPRPGACGCAVCAADGDCCGRMIPQSVKVRSVSRRRRVARLAVSYVRNV